MGFPFENLEIWKMAIELDNKIYEIMKKNNENNKEIVSQLMRASISISSNIAEGSANGKKGFRRYLDIALGSLFEVVSLLKICYNRKILKDKEYNDLYKYCDLLTRKIVEFKKQLTINH